MTNHRHHHQHTTRQDHLPELLDLDAEVLAHTGREIHAEIERVADGPVRTILDIGAGTGTGTIGLLRHFADAHAIAIDASDEMLSLLVARTDELGLADRVTTHRADLDAGVPALTPVDLAWASASLHHLAAPDRTLRELVAAIRPGGLLAVVELTGFPRFVADGTPGADAEARVHALLAADRATDMPAMGADWGARLEQAGMVVETRRAIEIDLAPPLPPAAGRYAAASLTRTVQAVADRLDPEDRATLGALLDGGPHDVRRRTDLRVTTTRWLWVARRPV
jgi:SAM-dependent methyltransferase